MYNKQILLVYSTESEEVYEAAAEMQRILHEDVPMVVAYENVYMQAYRTDVFEGHIEDLGRGIEGTWTLRNLRRIDNSSGGTVQIAIGDNPNTFNIFLHTNSYASSIMAELWPSLYLRGPDLRPFPYLAENILSETHSDNLSVPQGHTRFTIDINQYANWTDDTPLTAEDVVFSLQYAVESGVYGNPAGDSLTNLVAADAPTPYKAVIEFDSESYWLFSKFAYNYIIPKHIFNDIDGIGFSGWNSWDSVFWNSSMTQVTAGPFMFVDHVADEFYRISTNIDFWLHPFRLSLHPLYVYAPAATVGSVAVIIILVAVKKK
ncbi:MAG: ABC transporter substrate-binding protein [Candidatus Thorarchaeota archaeon]|jgi:ABC-type transport system substrate-binding protein